MIIHYQIAGTVGEGHVDRCSLPQGCPFSMVFIGLLMVPWVRLMRCMNVIPRCLADDLMIISKGKGDTSKYIKAM